MARNIKYGKIIIVIFLTVLIWVWADLALDERLSLSGVRITIAKSTDLSLWASFNNELSAVIDKVVLKGPASRVADVRRKLRGGLFNLEFFLDLEQEAMTNPVNHSLKIQAFLRKSDKIKQLGLTVEECDPNTLTVNVVGLVKKTLAVVCETDDATPVKTETIEPAQVEMFVPPGWEGEKLIAKVMLTRREIDQARLAPVTKKPYIELLPGLIREVPTAVKIITLTQPDPLTRYLITATLGTALSPTLQGQYKVDVTNLDAVMSPIAIRATPEAKRAYELQPFPAITLYILDDDKKTTDEQRRQVVYNFPDEYVRRDEIVLNQQPVVARFKLVPLSPAETTSGQVE
jgi:hypothetical protein